MYRHLFTFNLLFATFPKHANNAAVGHRDWDGENVGDNFATCKRTAIKQRKFGPKALILLLLTVWQTDAQGSGQAVDSHMPLPKCDCLR
jgi:hypothetical protein